MSEFSSIGLVGRQDNANISDSLNTLADFVLAGFENGDLVSVAIDKKGT